MKDMHEFSTKHSLLFALSSGLLCCLLFLCGRASAQYTTGTILGTLLDPSGAVIPGATVTATNLDTAFSRTVKTDETGKYILVNMPLGKYQVKAEAAGFKAGVNGPLTLVVDQKLRSDFVLTIGSETQVVDVVGGATPLLQADQPDINQIVQE